MTKEEFILYCDKLNIKISEELYNKFFTYFEMLVEWNNKFNYCNILAIIDQKAVDKQMCLNIPVIKVEKMECLQINYDYILIASKKYEREIRAGAMNKFSITGDGDEGLIGHR